jgi:hypothetical protein
VEGRLNAAAATAPLWVPLVVAAIGVGGTLLGGLAGALLTNHFAVSREKISWNRERQREYERWDREDRERTFEARRTALEDFYQSLEDMILRVFNHGTGSGDRVAVELPENWQADTLRRLRAVDAYATRETARLARAAYIATWNWGRRTIFGRADALFYDGQAAVESAEAEFLSALQRELFVPTEDEDIAPRSSS